jgi:Tannase and feruloyl esterase
MLRITAIAIALAIGTAGAAQAQIACESLKGLNFPNVKITEAKFGPSAPGVSPQGAKAVPTCTVSGVVGRETNFTVWMPDAWNGRFVMGGQGGFAGSVGSQAGTIMGALQLGYATAGTDTGHKSAGNDQRWAVDPQWGPERMVNYAHLAIHNVTEVSKAIVQARYGRSPDKSYFAGCSNGGRQGLMEAQRYPDDFDAIIAGANSVKRSVNMLGQFDPARKMYPDPKKMSAPAVSKDAREALAKAVLDKCDAADGLKDGILGDPEGCKFDLKTIACKPGQKTPCLSPQGIAAMDAYYNGASDKGVRYSPGYFPGGEDQVGWTRTVVGNEGPASPNADTNYPTTAIGLSLSFIRDVMMKDHAWSYVGVSLADLARRNAETAPLLDASSPDLDAFRKHGGKLLLYHGFSDPLVSPKMSLAYIDEIYKRDALAKSDVRLFMLPGVLHCAGGAGPDKVDWLTALDKWAGGSAAPDELNASFAAGSGARKVCAWPKKAVYKGTGDGRSPDQFECK